MTATAAKVALITGGFGAIGCAVADRLAEQGWVAVRAGRHPDGAGIAHDVTDPGSWKHAVDTVLDRHGSLDALVNAAGTLGGSDQTVLSTTPEQWHALLDTHVVGTWLGCREVIDRAPTSPVAIVNLSSTAGTNATPGMIAYGAMKAAVAHLTTSVALHCARAGLPIRCNAVAPALVDGGVRDDVLSTVSADQQQALAAYLARVPTGRLVGLAEVAEAVCFLATDGAPSLTGQVVTIAGGLGLA